MDYAIDTHFHLWDLQQFKYTWPTPDMPKLYRNITAKEYGESLTGTPVKYGIFVQCLNSKPEEAEWVISQTQENPFIMGVIVGLNLTNQVVLKKELENLAKYDKILGCRHILDFEPSDWISKEAVRKGIELVGQYGLTFDLLLRPPLLQYIPNLVSSLPSQKFVIDHIAKPYIKSKTMEPWKTEMAEIAKFPNVFCKISGLVTEADHQNWNENDFKPYINHVIDIFGADRLMYGSDWPVCTQANAEYKDVFSLTESLVSHLSDKEKCAIFKDNAMKIYNVKT